MKNRPTGRARKTVTLIVAVLVLLAALPATSSPAQAGGPRVDLIVLVLDDGGPQVDALISELDQRGTPRTIVDLNDPARPAIDATFLSDVAGELERARFQAVILPSNEVVVLGQVTQAEMDALDTYEAHFGIRRAYARVWAGPSVGLNWTQYNGPLDGAVATVTPAGLAGPFGYLAGSLTVDAFAWGYLATPLDPPPDGETFTSLVEVPVPGEGWSAPLIGVHTLVGREQLVVAMGANRHQGHLRALAPGIIDWVTRGVNLGYARNYLSVHIDDIFMSDARWSTVGNCTPEDDCPRNPDGSEIYPTEPIRMTADDLLAVRQWQQAQGFVLDFAYNGAGSDEAFATQVHDPLSESLLANRHRFRWINHTYSHPFMGCLQDFSVIPWQCVGGTANPQYLDEPTIVEELVGNIGWAQRRRIPFDPNELVPGEHSGLRVEPQQPADNPNFVSALGAAGISYVASDASREPEQRFVGSALTVPRHPMNIFYNVGTEAEEVDEYNWIYTSTEDGGSGICTIDPRSTCISPLDSASGFQSYIVPLEAGIALGHVMGNDPRPHYAHQSNLAEDRILLPVLDELLARYRGIYAPDTPIVAPTMTQAAIALRRSDVWEDAQAGVTAYLQDGTVTIESANGTVHVPLTTPTGSTIGGVNHGTAYAGRSSGWVSVGAGSPVTVTIAAES
ncbi:MAG: hypothetical protein U5K29_02210 [Acidimicrobiales bacterium]|nr:hypothetical protein [Acidimicrobiales bacterium]